MVTLPKRDREPTWCICAPLEGQGVFTVSMRPNWSDNYRETCVWLGNVTRKTRAEAQLVLPYTRDFSDIFSAFHIELGEYVETYVVHSICTPWGRKTEVWDFQVMIRDLLCVVLGRVLYKHVWFHKCDIIQLTCKAFWKGECDTNERRLAIWYTTIRRKRKFHRWIVLQG